MKKYSTVFGIIFMFVLVMAFAVVFAACGETPDTRNYFIVRFDKNNSDPDGTEAVPRTKNVFNSPWMIDELPKQPTRVGYVFIEWNKDKNGDGEEFIAITPVGEDVTVYAQWEEGAVTVSEPGVRTIPFPSLEEALDSITTTGVYTVRVNSDQSIAKRTFSGAELNVTIEAMPGREVVINFAGAVVEGSIFIVNNGASLTLGDGITLDGQSKTGYGVVVNGSGTSFTMNGGTIKGYSGTNSAGVSVANNGKFTMNGGTINGNTASNGGGVYNDAEFIMNGGTINGNTAIGDGGGVYNLGELTMNGGTISGNTASNGGGVYVYGSTVFKMNGGAISGNTSDNSGGGVYNQGNFTMDGAETAISGNNANSPVVGKGGGGVYSPGTFTMENGIISGNTTNSDGGGVNVTYDIIPGSFSMKNGFISDNNAVKGGGVYSSREFFMENGTINGNKASGIGGGGVYVDGGTFIKADGIITGNDGFDPTLSGNVADSGDGHAVYADKSTLRWRDRTVTGPIDASSDEVEDWDYIDIE